MNNTCRTCGNQKIAESPFTGNSTHIIEINIGEYVGFSEYTYKVVFFDGTWEMIIYITAKKDESIIDKAIAEFNKRRYPHVIQTKIEKDFLKKVVVIENPDFPEGRFWQEGTCPTCNSPLYEKDNFIRCPICGQRITWKHNKNIEDEPTCSQNSKK